MQSAQSSQSGGEVLVHKRYIFFWLVVLFGFALRVIIYSLGNTETLMESAQIIQGADSLGEQSKTFFPYSSLGYAIIASLVSLSEIFSVSLGGIFLWFCLCLELISSFSINKLAKRKSVNFWLWLYWLNPALVYCTYYLGTLDFLIAIFAAATAIYWVNKRLVIAAILLLISLFIKPALLLGLPIFLLYVVGSSHPFREKISCLVTFLIGFGIWTVMLSLNPLLLESVMSSNGGVLAIITSPDRLILPQISIFGVGLGILIGLALKVKIKSVLFFIALFASCYVVASIINVSGVSWFVWGIGFWWALGVLHPSLAHTKFVYVLQFWAVWLVVRLATPSWFHTGALSEITILISGPIGIIITSIAGVALVWSLREYLWELYRSFDLFDVNKRPFLVGIAGDSSVGKDTLAESLYLIFGHQMLHISGDNYHRFDRANPIWKSLTHLNPVTNNLDQLFVDLCTLRNRGSINVRKYCHDTGVFRSPQKVTSRNFIIASGLHCFWSGQLQAIFDLKVFIDMDENLRRFLKIRRDVADRGHSLSAVLESIERRAGDSMDFIKPQMEYADILFFIRPTSSANSIFKRPFSDLTDSELVNSPVPHLMLDVYDEFEGDSVRVLNPLISVCGLHVDVQKVERKTVVSVDGHVLGEDLKLASKQAFSEFIYGGFENVEFKNGVEGLMQYFILSHMRLKAKMGRGL